MKKLEFKKTKAEEAIELELKQLDKEPDTKTSDDFSKKTKTKTSKADADSKTEGEIAINFVKDLTEKMNVDCNLSLVEDDEKIDIIIKGQNTGALIGYRGDVLDSIQYLTSSLINNDKNGYKRVTIDCENYREKRAVILAGLARRLADKAIRTGRKVSIEPMNPSERRIIHSTLQENSQVSTSSEGVEPNRHIIITPKDLKDDSPNFKNKNYNDRKSFNENKKPQRETEKRTAYKTGFGSFLGNTKSYKD